jgi:hypothetical protein
MSEVVDRLAAALNAHDLEAAAALMHENYRSEQPAHPGRALRRWHGGGARGPHRIQGGPVSLTPPAGAM